jgi:hypothetical protein
MNIFILHIRQLDIGCCIKSMFAGCLLYADDIILICPSVSDLQDMLDLCVTMGKTVSLKFNPLKSCCLGIGKASQ